MIEFKQDNLVVKQYQDRVEMGKAAADEVVSALKKLLLQKQEVNMIFAAAPSQNEVLEALTEAEGIQWDKVNAFHMDEYIGLDEKAPQGFGNFLKERLFNKLPFKAIHTLNGQCQKPEEECKRYSALLLEYPADICLMGIGENGHIAFNDPHVACFNDAELVKIVSLDEMCRIQQVNDGCFTSILEVPKKALTLTIPALISAQYIFCCVPGKRKAQAVYNTLKGPIDEACPAAILRKHQQAVLYIDKDSGSLL